MAGVADDLAFFGDHGVAALGTGVKEGFHFINGGRVIQDAPELQQRGKGRDGKFAFRILFIHKSSVTRLFNLLNAVICPLIKGPCRFKLASLPSEVSVWRVGFFNFKLKTRGFCVRLGRRQAVSHQILDLAFVGSNPTAPAILYPAFIGVFSQMIRLSTF